MEWIIKEYDTVTMPWRLFQAAAEERLIFIKMASDDPPGALCCVVPDKAAESWKSSASG
jgi:hypothetical protein